MEIRGATPPVVRRAASFVSPHEVPDVKPARDPWTPAKHGWVFAKCGHVCADDAEIVAINAILSTFKNVKVWCDRCKVFVAAVKKASALDRLGLVPLPSPDSDEPPF